MMIKYQPDTSRHTESKSDATRARIIAAASMVLSEVGYRQTRLSAIAREAELQTGSLYYHFSSKDELVEETLSSGVAIAQCRVQESLNTLPPNATAGSRLRTAITAFIEARLEIGSIASAHHRSYRHLPPTMRQRLRPGLEKFSALWDHLVSAAIASGELRTDIEPFTLHLFVVHTSEQIFRWPHSARRSNKADAHTMTSLILDGVRACARPSTES